MFFIWLKIKTTYWIIRKLHWKWTAKTALKVYFKLSLLTLKHRNENGLTLQILIKKMLALLLLYLFLVKILYQINFIMQYSASVTPSKTLLQKFLRRLWEKLNLSPPYTSNLDDIFNVFLGETFTMKFRWDSILLQRVWIKNYPVTLSSLASNGLRMAEQCLLRELKLLKI